VWAKDSNSAPADVGLEEGTLAPIASEHEFLALGLTIAKYDKWEKYLPHRQITKFKEKNGAIPKTCKMM